jgi:hypothetical protein
VLKGASRNSTSYTATPAAWAPTGG